MTTEGPQPREQHLGEFVEAAGLIHTPGMIARRRLLVFLKAAIFTIFIPGTMTVGFPAGVLALRGEIPPPETGGLLGLASILLLGLGGFVYFWTAFDFADKGRGTPFPLDPPKVVVRRGLYGWVRNPMYLGVMTVVLGEAALFRAPELLVYLSSVLAGFLLFVRFYEEPNLRRRFGTPYEQYCREVPRWLPRRPGAGS